MFHQQPVNICGAY